MPDSLPDPQQVAPERPKTGFGGRFRMLRTVTALMLREIATTYGRSFGGYLWALADPILGIALLTLIFQGVMGRASPPIGTNFPLFYATGYIVFQMYNDLAGKIAASLRYSRPLLAYPAVTFVDALLARWVLNTLLHVVVFVLVVAGIVLGFRLTLVMDAAVVVQALALTALLGLGVGTMNCFLTMRFPVWERVWSIFNRPLFLMSGVFFTYDMMPRVAQELLWWNPVLHLVGLMRRGVYGIYPADYVSVTYVVALSLGLLMLGLLLLRPSYRDLLET